MAFRNQTRNRLRTAAILLAGLGALGACRGGISTSPPVHLVPDMDFQQKIKAQSEFHFDGWKDGRGMRAPVAGTVSRESQEIDPRLLAFKKADGAYATDNPVTPTLEVLERGRERFGIHCAACHGLSGRGGNGPEAHGIVGRRWPVVIPSFHAKAGGDAMQNRVPNLADGELFEVITKGKGTMPAYAGHLTPADRWAVIHYIRALQNLGKQN